jgi:hypothetical protein
MTSKHYNNQRVRRERFIEEHLHNDGIMIDGFIVDRGHEHGAECHSITDKGIIVIHNLQSGKLITKLLSRPAQIRRYYEMTGRETPPEYESVLKLAKAHAKLKYNSA